MIHFFIFKFILFLSSMVFIFRASLFFYRFLFRILFIAAIKFPFFFIRIHQQLTITRLIITTSSLRRHLMKFSCNTLRSFLSWDTWVKHLFFYSLIFSIFNSMSPVFPLTIWWMTIHMSMKFRNPLFFWWRWISSFIVWSLLQ